LKKFLTALLDLPIIHLLALTESSATLATAHADLIVFSIALVVFQAFHKYLTHLDNHLNKAQIHSHIIGLFITWSIV